MHSTVSSSENPLVRFTILLFAVIFLGGVVFAWFDVITHENMLTKPELEFASGYSMSGLLFLRLGLRGWQRRRRQSEPNDPAERLSA